MMERKMLSTLLVADAASKSYSAAEYALIFTIIVMMVTVAYSLIFDRDSFKHNPPSDEVEWIKWLE